MSRVLVTGMSGAGKTSLLSVLSARGHLTVDTDDDGWVLADLRWDEARMASLLSAPLDVLLDRLERRTSNPYGQTPAHRAEVARYLDTVEPLLRAGATVELDGRLPSEELAAVVEQLLRDGQRGPDEGRQIT